MTVHKEVGICISWNEIVTDVLKTYGAIQIREDEIKEISEVMQSIEHRYIDIE